MTFPMSLRYRIVSLTMLFAVILIAVFTTLLINRQLHQIAENNQFRARIGTFAAKGAFERALLSNIRAGNPEAAFQRLIPILQQGQLAEEVIVSDLKGQVVAAGNTRRIGTQLTEEENRWIEYSQKTYSPESWFCARVLPEEILFYTPITLDDVPQYLVILRYSLGNMRQAIQQIGQLCFLVALGVMAVIVPLSLLLIQAILRPIRILNRATKDISAGNLGLRVAVHTEDELGELADTFNSMTSALLKMKERAENANPLTKLPGNNVIHEEVEKRIKAKKKFVAIYSDLDNFKAFNDKYGIGAGDQAIRITASILKEAIKNGGTDDFLGHEGGDDFFLLTSPERVDEVTQHVCTEFDKRIKQLYSPEDLGQGYIVSKDREGNVKQFPLMTISLAGVTNAHRELSSYAEVTNICAEVKKKAKLTSKGSGRSSFFLDRRLSQETETPTPEAHSS
ncbi:MAG: HAMP domain-containing protein [Candidatus Omnitrophica bacterium]|nr:HAMP domain-containing protein [Candidatus Omnitrophota bacterium]